MSGLQPILALGGEVRKGAIRGAIGELRVLPVAALRIDQTYQRSISVKSVRNVRAICEGFDWAKFLPVIVVEHGDVFAVIDGQHRTTAAITLGIDAVPCYVLRCSPVEAAAAFAAINGAVTPMNAVDIWFAELAAGAAHAVALQRVLDAAEVKVVRKKDGWRVGETRSVRVLVRALDKYGTDLLTTILQCITQTGDGNPGMIVGAVVNGIGVAIRTKTSLLREPSRLFDFFDGFQISEHLEAAHLECARTGNVPQAVLTREINVRLPQEIAR